MRLRILELPTEHDGDSMRTPFVYVVDRVDDVRKLDVEPPEVWQLGGAVGVLVFADAVDFD